MAKLDLTFEELSALSDIVSYYRMIRRGDRHFDSLDGRVIRRVALKIERAYDKAEARQ